MKQLQISQDIVITDVIEYYGHCYYHYDFDLRNQIYICISYQSPTEKTPEEPFWLTWLALNPAWTGNYLHHKVCDEIINPFPNVDDSPLKFGNGLIISSHTL